jgi:hypothetical protein
MRRVNEKIVRIGGTIVTRWEFVRAIFNAPVWLQAGYYLALAAQITAEQKSGCPRLAEQGTEERSPIPYPLCSMFYIPILGAAANRQ